MELNARIPSGPIERKWDTHRFEMKLVNPANKRKHTVLVVGSGNIVHNLHAYGWGKKNVEPYDWAVRFEATARELIVAGQHEPLVNYETLGKDALLSAPTPDHYLPLIYVLGLQRDDDQVTFPVEGFDGGSVSMTTVRLG